MRENQKPKDKESLLNEHQHCFKVSKCLRTKWYNLKKKNGKLDNFFFLIKQDK